MADTTARDFICEGSMRYKGAAIIESDATHRKWADLAIDDFNLTLGSFGLKQRIEILTRINIDPGGAMVNARADGDFNQVGLRINTQHVAGRDQRRQDKHRQQQKLQRDAGCCRLRSNHRRAC